MLRQENLLKNNIMWSFKISYICFQVFIHKSFFLIKSKLHFERNKANVSKSQSKNWNKNFRRTKGIQFWLILKLAFKIILTFDSNFRKLNAIP